MRPCWCSLKYWTKKKTPTKYHLGHCVSSRTLNQLCSNSCSSIIPFSKHTNAPKITANATAELFVQEPARSETVEMFLRKVFLPSEIKMFYCRVPVVPWSWPRDRKWAFLLKHNRERHKYACDMNPGVTGGHTRMSFFGLDASQRSEPWNQRRWKKETRVTWGIDRVAACARGALEIYWFLNCIFMESSLLLLSVWQGAVMQRPRHACCLTDQT